MRETGTSIPGSRNRFLNCPTAETERATHQSARTALPAGPTAEFAQFTAVTVIAISARTAPYAKVTAAPVRLHAAMVHAIQERTAQFVLQTATPAPLAAMGNATAEKHARLVQGTAERAIAATPHVALTRNRGLQK